MSDNTLGRTAEEFRAAVRLAAERGSLTASANAPAATVDVDAVANTSSSGDGIEPNNVVGTIRLREEFSLPLIVSFLSPYFICGIIISRD